MTYPEQFGQPCWDREQAEKCINIVAQVTREKVSLFLATHSPIKNIKDAKADSLVTEEEAYQKLFSRKGEIRGVVRGGSGTGKSHLIRWINLRAEYASGIKEFGLDQFKIVMVQRETGSLRAALKQIVDQLGAEFSQYIEDIKTSVDRFSAETAREELIQGLALEINSKWEQRGNSPLPRNLKPLGDVLLSPGYRRWLGRDGGIVAQKIARLTESSTPEDREKGIVFTDDELRPPPGTLNRSEDAPQVYDFIDDLEFDEDTAEETVKVLNQALIDAQRELTGIKGAKLHEIFTAIRRKLYNQGKQLAVFIEDVTAASGGLDLDLFQAFEPRAGKNLCRMIALLGMTNEGWNVLPHNERDRVDFQFDVGENAIQWATIRSEVAEFAARYLNAIRCDEQEINDLAQDRFASDVPNSKCDECPHKKVCHETFGYAQLENNVKIGLFPFSSIAPYKLLKALNQERHRSSPRGLLDLVLNVALAHSYDQFVQNTFPDPKSFGVTRSVLTYWTEVENKYLGGAAWSARSDRNRVLFLAEFWFTANSADETASRLDPFRVPLLLPDFSAKPTKVETPGDIETKPDSKLKSEALPTDPQLKQLLGKLNEWSEGNSLTSDSTFRGFLSKLIGKAIKWQDYRGVPINFANKCTSGTGPFRIEGQTADPKNVLYTLTFPRDEETRHLLEGLLHYEREGKGSWNFESGELHKRRVHRYLRKHQQRIVKSLEPRPPSLTQDAVKGAAQLLALAAIFRTRSPLPKKDPQKRVLQVFTEIWEDGNRPQVLTDSLDRFVNDIQAKWKNAKELLIRELGVGQGASAPRDYINPIPILEALENFEDSMAVAPPPKEINENFWKVRFEAVAKLSAYADFHKALDEENAAITDHLTKLKELLLEFGFKGKDLKHQLATCVKEIIEVIELQRKNMQYPNDRFDALWESKRLHNNRDVWGKSVARAAKVIANPTDIDTLCFEPTFLKQVRYDLAIVTKEHLAAVEKELGEQENPGGAEQGGTKEGLLNELRQVTEMLDKD